MQKGDVTKERIKEVSMGLFHAKGYRNTSINDILESSGVKKGNFYFHYHSKDNLVNEVLEKALSNYEDEINSNIEHLPVMEQLLGVINAVEQYHIKNGTSKGCCFGNIALELGHDGSEISSFVEGVFKRFETRFEKLIVKAVNTGELQLKESPIVLSRMILAAIEGGVLLSKISGDPQPTKDCMGFIKTVIEERRVK